MDLLAIVVILLVTEGNSTLLVQRSDLSWAPLCIPCILHQSCGHGLRQYLHRSSSRSWYTSAAAILYDCCSGTCSKIVSATLLTLRPSAATSAYSQVLMQSCAVDPGAVSSNIYANSRLPSPVRWFIRNLHAPTSDGASAVVHAATTPMPLVIVPSNGRVKLDELPVANPLRVSFFCVCLCSHEVNCVVCMYAQQR